jgi:ankyrin repeat protein
MRRRTRSAAPAAFCCALLLLALPAGGQLFDDEEFDPEELLAAMRAEQLVEAAAAGDLERVGALLEGGIPADHPYPRSDTALLAAAAGGHDSVVALLLERGADPNRTGDRGRSPLSSAYEAGSPAIARRLLDAGARVPPPAATGRSSTLLGRAVADRRGEWIELLRAHGATLGSDEANRLLAAALDERAPDRLERLRLLLDLGADPDYRPASGIRPLIHVAVLHGAPAEVELLIDRGADVEAKDGFLGESTLYVAVKTGRAALVQRLLELEAEIDARAKDGTTPLFAALAQRRDDLARRLIEAGARVDAASGEGRTPLMELVARRLPRDAIAGGDYALAALIDLLIDRGAGIDAVDGRGRSALSLAGTACNLTALSALARHGAAIGTETWIDVLHAPCAPRWPHILDELRAELDLPVPSLEELSRGPLRPPDPRDADAQRRTMAEMREVGTALMSWLTDQVSRHGAPPRVRFAADSGEGAAEHGVEISGVPAVGASHLRRFLVPLYLHDVPEVDGWGFRYDYRIADSVFGPGPVLVLRSPGSDGLFSGDRYPEPLLPKGLYPPSETHRDIVWVDGRFLQAPRLIGWTGPPASTDHQAAVAP